MRWPPTRWPPMRYLKYEGHQTTRMFSDTWDSRLTAGLMARGSEIGVREGVPREWLKG
jgi:hypothetical protein